MKKQKLPTASKFTIVRQACNYIPNHLVPRFAWEPEVDKQARTYDAWSHIVTLCYSQVTHSIGLNDGCDALQLNSGPLSAIRGATPPTRNNLSHANKVRDAAMAEELFWAVYDYLGDLSPKFVSGKAAKRFARKFKRTIHVVDSTTIQLIASCMDWAKHRRRKAAAKCHLRLDLQSFLPRFALVDTARHNDAKRARELCAGIKAGEIVIFDKAYVDFAHLADLSLREGFWVTRANAVRWQVWTALLVYLLLRYLAFLSEWSHSFSRLFTLLRAALWKKWDLLSLLRRYGTADGQFRYLARPEQAYLPGWG